MVELLYLSFDEIMLMRFNFSAFNAFVTESVLSIAGDEYAHHELLLATIQRSQIRRGDRAEYPEPPIAYKGWKFAVSWSLIKFWQDRPIILLVGFLGIAFSVGQLLTWFTKYGFSLIT